VLTSFGSFSLHVSNITGSQLNRSNSRSFVILGDQPLTPKLNKGGSFTRNIEFPNTRRSPRLRPHYLGAVAERDSRGESGSFAEIPTLSPKASKQFMSVRSTDSADDESIHSARSIKSAADKNKVLVSSSSSRPAYPHLLRRNMWPTQSRTFLPLRKLVFLLLQPNKGSITRRRPLETLQRCLETRGCFVHRCTCKMPSMRDH
jgi:hypothetical protein